MPGKKGKLVVDGGRKRPAGAKDPERTRANIIDVATAEFAERGLSGARVDRIAERTQTSKRMLYYYFGDKEGLYRAVLLSYYEKLRSGGKSTGSGPPAATGCRSRRWSNSLSTIISNMRRSSGW